MPKLTFDSTSVLLARCEPGKAKTTYFDTNTTGFVMEVRPDGGRTYALRYEDKYGRQRQFKIANAADVTFAEARKRAQRAKARVSVGQDPAEERKLNRQMPTVNELAVRYLEFVGKSKKSHDIDERYLRLHLLPRFGKLHLNQLRQDEIVKWLRSKVVDEGYAQATVNRWQVILGYMMRLAKQWGLPGAETNPLEGVRQKDPGNRIERFLNPEETARLKAAVDESPNCMLRYIVALLLLTGCRKRELLDARWADFDLPKKRWRIPMSKNGKPRHVPLSEEAIAVLDRIPRFGECEYVVPNPDTLKPFLSIYNSWHQARKRAGLTDVRMHDLRHSAASNLVNAGQSLYVVAKVLGHSQTRTTERYAHLDNGVLLTAVNKAASVTGTDWATD